MIEDWRKHKVNEIPMAHSYSTGFLQEIHQNLRDPRGIFSIFTQQDPSDLMSGSRQGEVRRQGFFNWWGGANFVFSFFLLPCDGTEVPEVRASASYMSSPDYIHWVRCGVPCTVQARYIRMVVRPPLILQQSLHGWPIRGHATVKLTAFCVINLHDLSRKGFNPDNR